MRASFYFSKFLQFYRDVEKISGVTGGGGPPWVTPEVKNCLWANLQRIVEKRGRTGKKGVR